MLLTFIFPEFFAHIFTDDINLIKDCIPVMRIVSCANIVFAISFVVFNGVSGTGNTRTAFAIEVLTLFFYISYVYYTAILNPKSVAVVWMSEFVYWIIVGSFAYLYLLKGGWRKKEI